MSTEGLARYILEKRAADPDLVVVVPKDPARAPYVRRKPRPTARQEEARACMSVGLRGLYLADVPPEERVAVLRKRFGDLLVSVRRGGRWWSRRVARRQRIIRSGRGRGGSGERAVVVS